MCVCVCVCVCVRACVCMCTISVYYGVLLYYKLVLDLVTKLSDTLKQTHFIQYSILFKHINIRTFTQKIKINKTNNNINFKK